MAAMPDSDIAALRNRCTKFLHGHGPENAAELLPTIPADTEVDRYGEGGVVAELEAEIARLCSGRTRTGVAAARSSFIRCATWNNTRGRATAGCIS
jgi:hypothetical protein